MFSCEFRKIFKNTRFEEPLQICFIWLRYNVVDTYVQFGWSYG